MQPAVVVSTSGSSRTVTPADSGIAANYVIITTAAIQAGSTNLAAFVANQQARGYTVAVETEGSWGGGVGNSAADNIRNWLTANYVSMGIQYVLLVGNPDPTAGDVPMKITWPMGPGGMQAPTDFYYANLTNIWDANGDGKPGEWGSDFTSVPATQVTVGRIPDDAADYASLDAILAKTISYENSSNTAWRKSMLLPIGISNYYNEDGAAVARTDGSSLGEAIKNNLAAPGGYRAYTMYEKSGLQPVTTASNAALTEANVVNQWSTTPYGIVDWWSHGDASDADRYVWTADSNHDGTPQSSEMSYTPFFTSSDAAALNNNYPSIVVQVACDNGDPQDSSNLGYALLKQGAVATFCASAYTWYSQGPWSPSLGLTYGDDASYAYYITQQLTAAPLAATTGAALQWCRANFGTGWADGSSWMNALAMNLDGDPSLSLLPPAQIHGTAVNDANGNGAWDAGEPGVSGRTVFLDDNNDGRPDGGTNTLASGNVNLAIPDGVGNLTATQALGGVSASISSVTVTLNITHSFDSDLTAYLVSPAGVQIQLFSHVGGSGTNFTNTVFSDAASTAIAAGTAPFSGSFRPAQPLSVLDGLSPDGTWQLIVADGVSGDSGTLNNWTLTINTQERSTTTDANGSYVFNNLTPGTYRVRLVAQSGWQNTAPTSGEQDVTLGAGQNMTGANFLADQTVASIAVAPTGGLASDGTEQFAATALDSAGKALVNQPAFAWSVDGGGAINNSGVLTPTYTHGSTAVVAKSGAVSGSCPVMLPGDARWTSATDCSWNDANTWASSALGTTVAAPGVRGVTGDTALFDTATGHTVSLNGSSPSLAGITFSGGSGYTIAQGSAGSLQLSSSTAAATVTAVNGNPTISAPVTLDSNVEVSATTGSTLTIAGNVSGSNALIFSGPGKLVLRGANSYTGGTTVHGGTLFVALAGALRDGSNLSVGAGLAIFG